MPAEVLTRWNFDLPLLALLAIAATSGLRGFRTGSQGRNAILAIAVSLLLFISPLCALSSALFSARVLHHILLIAALAPLLAGALPAQATVRQGSLATWTLLQAIVLWFWHSPDAYAAALASDVLYWAMQASLLGVATMFWRRISEVNAPSGTAALLFTTVQMGLLGALITFAGAPLYAPHFATTLAWGMTPLEDQQLAGLSMWVPAGALYLAAALLFAHRALGPEEPEFQR